MGCVSYYEPSKHRKNIKRDLWVGYWVFWILFGFSPFYNWVTPHIVEIVFVGSLYSYWFFVSYVDWRLWQAEKREDNGRYTP
jgi:hypothetical protein